MQKFNFLYIAILIFFICTIVFMTADISYAQTVPSTADSTRIDQELQKYKKKDILSLKKFKKEQKKK